MNAHGVKGLAAAWDLELQRFDIVFLQILVANEAHRTAGTAAAAAAGAPNPICYPLDDLLEG